jgi:hypothetical protein
MTNTVRTVTRAGLTYSPRYNILEFNEHATVSLVGHFTAWFDFWSNAGHTLHLPFVMEGNFGHAASEGADFPFGAFIGGGMAYNNMYSTEGNQALGPVGTFGIRSNFGSSSSYTTRVSFLLNMVGSATSSVFALGVSYNFGVD